MNIVNGPRRAHVFGIESGHDGLLTRAKNHAVPMGKAVSIRQIQGMIEDRRSGENQRKQVSKNLHMGHELRTRYFAPVFPAPELLNGFAKHLPK